MFGVGEGGVRWRSFFREPTKLRKIGFLSVRNGLVKCSAVLQIPTKVVFFRFCRYLLALKRLSAVIRYRQKCRNRNIVGIEPLENAGYALSDTDKTKKNEILSVRVVKHT